MYMIAIRLGELRPAYITPVSANVQITESPYSREYILQYYGHKAWVSEECSIGVAPLES